MPAGKLVADTLQESGGQNVPVVTVVQGSAKAWVNFDGTGTVAIRDSFNVSSITDNGTGDYTVNFTNSMPNANYMSLVTLGGTSGGVAAKNGDQDTPRTTSLVRVQAINTSNVLQDNAVMSVGVFGDQ